MYYNCLTLLSIILTFLFLKRVAFSISYKGIFLSLCSLLLLYFLFLNKLLTHLNDHVFITLTSKYI